MTEKTDNKDNPATEVRRYIIDPVAFFIALFMAPILAGLLTCFLIIPVFAVPFGAPLYLTIGTPALLVYMRYYPAKPLDLAILAFAVIAALMLLTAVLSLFFALPSADAIFGYLMFGLIFGPYWAAVFGVIYKGLCRQFFAAPYPA